MFSSLAQGKASWAGGIELQDFEQNTSSPVDPLLPHLFLRSPVPPYQNRSKSAKSHDTSGTVLDDGQIVLPKTFVTRKGAILLFTPNEELIFKDQDNYNEDETRKHLPDIYEVGLKLGTVGNLTSTVLQFGREEEHAWEGLPVNDEKCNTDRKTKNKQAFLKFLHYLDSDSRLDKFTQPGCDQDFYLDELKSKSGMHGTPQFKFGGYSARSYPNCFGDGDGDDDDGISDIILEYLRCSGHHMGRKTPGLRVTEPDYVSATLQGMESFPEHVPASTSPEHVDARPRTVTISPYDTSSPACWSPTYMTTDPSSRPHTAPIPPQPQSPRANPRITSAKPPPPARALGSTPTDLQEVLQADIGRSYRRSPSPPARFNRSVTSSPMFFTSPSRGGSPEYSSMARLGSFPRGGSPEYSAMAKLGSSPCGNGREMARLESSLGKFDDYPRGPDVIDEEDEASSVSSRWVSGRGHRPSSAGSLISTQSTERLSERRVSSAGASSQRTRASASRTNCIASAGSSVLRQPTTASVFARDGDLSSVQNASEPSDRERINDCGASGRASPARSISAREKPARSQSVLSHRSSDSKISRASPLTLYKNSASATRTTSGRSRASRTEGDLDHQSVDGDLPDDDVAVVSSSSFSRHSFVRPPNGSQSATRSKTSSASSQRGRIAASRQSQWDRESAATPQTDPGVWETPNDTIATLGSEADLDEVTETINRTQSVADGVLDDFNREEDSPEVAWPPVCEDDYGSEAEEVDIELASSRSSSIHSLDGNTEQPPDEGTSSSMDSLRPAFPDETSSIEILPERPELDEDASRDPSPDLEFQAALSALEASHYQPPASSPMLEAPIIREPDGDNIPHSSGTAAELTGDAAGGDSRFDIEKSRPSSPVCELERDQSVSVTAAVAKYIQEGHRPQSRLSRSRQGSETGSEDKQPEPGAGNEALKVRIEPDRVANQKESERPKSSRHNRETVKPTSFKEKEKNEKDFPAPKEPVKSLPSINLVNQDDLTKASQPTDKEKEARRELVSSLLSKPKPTTDGSSLGLKGEGRGVEEAATPRTEASVKPPAHDEKKNKTDLSDLAALLGPPKPPKEKKSEARKKSAKPRKSAKKKAEPAPVSVDPENINFDVFNSPEMLEHMDEELKQFVQQQGSSQPVVKETAVDVRRTSVQTLEVPAVARQVTNEIEGAHSPSKTKKPTKKELAARRAQARKEEKKRKEDEKKRREKEKNERDEELMLLKQREDEAAKARAEAEAKQQMMEEETERRMAEEEEARKEEQDAQERLKNAKRKAREEREARRALEAERRRQEVQRKREEKLHREQELRERETQAENQKLDRERRMVEVAEQRRLQAEMERLEEEQRQEEERLQLLHEEEEERRLEEERVREAEEELQRLQEERELREQMRHIAEAQAEKLRKAEEERQKLEEEERRRIEEERRRLEEEELARVHEEQKRQEMAKRLEAVARMRAAQQAAIRKSLLIRRCEQNQESVQNLKFTRQSQGVTRPHVFTYFVHVPRQYWELPIGYDKKNKGNRIPRRKPPPQKKEEPSAS